MTDTLLLINSDMKVTLSDGQLIVRQNDDIVGRHPLEVTRNVQVFGNPQLTTQAVKACLKHGIEIQYYTVQGRYLGSTQPSEPKDTSRRLTQYAILSDDAKRLAWSRSLLNAKLHTHLLQYRRLRDNGWLKPDRSYPATVRSQLDQLPAATTLAELMGCEGMAARDYFDHFGQALPQGWLWTGRHYHPATDPINALLSLTYAMVKQLLDANARKHGYDPTLSFFHRHGYGSGGLATDLIELMRCCFCDHAILKALHARHFATNDFSQNTTSCQLTGRAHAKYYAFFNDSLRPHAQKFVDRLFSLLNRAIQTPEQSPDFLPLFPAR